MWCINREQHLTSDVLQIKHTFQIDNLRVFQLLDLIKSSIHIIKCEQRKIFTVVSGLRGKKERI